MGPTGLRSARRWRWRRILSRARRKQRGVERNVPSDDVFRGQLLTPLSLDIALKIPSSLLDKRSPLKRLPASVSFLRFMTPVMPKETNVVLHEDGGSQSIGL